MTVETDIQTALLLRLCPVNTVATSDITSPATPVALPLVAYAPTGVEYLHVHPIMRAEPAPVGFGFDSSVERRGIFQVDAVMPDNKGEPPGTRLADLVAARFARGTALVAGSYRLQIDKEPHVAAAVKDAPWVRFPVSIRYLIIT